MVRFVIALMISFFFIAVPLNISAAAPPKQDIEAQIFQLPLNYGPSYWTRLERITYIKGQLSKLHPVDIKYDESVLTEKEKKMLVYLLEAAGEMDKLFLKQAYSRNEEILEKLKNSKDPLDALTLRYFVFNACPFDRINDMNPFYGHEKRPAGANFYPSDLTKSEFEKWVADHPEEQKSFMGEFTVIKRSGGKLIAVPYNREYAQELKKAAALLRKAAEFAENESLRRYLLSRADAFLSDDYYRSDVDWMTIEDSALELVIGPYEVYEDNLMNYKAAYEAFIYQNLPQEAKAFSSYVSYLPELEKNLPIPDADKNMDRDFTSPIRIANLIYSAGDAKAGVHTSAFALPNDERVRKEKGCKKVMLKNVMSAKFAGSTYPIAQKVIEPKQLKYVKFESYFRDVVFHELAHGLGPGELKMADGSRKDVRICLGDLYSSIEECKADTLAMYNQFYLMDKGIIDKNDYENMCVSYLTGLFRSIRFGVEEAHGLGALIQLNWMMDKGAFVYDAKTGTYSVDFAKFRSANTSLSKTLLDIQRNGSYDQASLLVDKYGHIASHLSKTFETLYEVPIDILPSFKTN